MLLVFFLIPPVIQAETSTRVQDATGGTATLEAPPRKAVSLVLSFTEILCRIGAGAAISGVIHHDTYPPEAATKPVVGGFFAPSPEWIAALDPDVLIAKAVYARVQDGCDRISEEIAGRRIEKKHAFIFTKPLSPVLTAAFEALLNGLAAKSETENE